MTVEYVVSLAAALMFKHLPYMDIIGGSPLDKDEYVGKIW
jgi:hypothetical protein